MNQRIYTRKTADVTIGNKLGEDGIFWIKTSTGFIEPIGTRLPSVLHLKRPDLLAYRRYTVRMEDANKIYFPTVFNKRKIGLLTLYFMRVDELKLLLKENYPEYDFKNSCKNTLIFNYKKQTREVHPSWTKALFENMKDDSYVGIL